MKVLCLLTLLRVILVVTVEVSKRENREEDTDKGFVSLRKIKSYCYKSL